MVWLVGWLVDRLISSIPFKFLLLYFFLSCLIDSNKSYYFTKILGVFISHVPYFEEAEPWIDARKKDIRFDCVK